MLGAKHEVRTKESQPPADFGLVADVLVAEFRFQMTFLSPDGPPVHDEQDWEHQWQDPAVVEEQSNPEIPERQRHVGRVAGEAVRPGETARARAA